jgi:aminopeptidase N
VTRGGRGSLASVGALAALAAAGPLAAQADSTPPPHAPTSYDIILATSDTGTHFVGEVQTGWRLQSGRPVDMRLDSTLRVVRVLIDGKPNTRLSRTMYGRVGSEVVVPHEKGAGDTLSTRVRYHGTPRGGLRVGSDRTGARALAGETAGGRAPLWLPSPEGSGGRVTVAWHIQASAGQRAVANGTLAAVDTLAYGHTTWHYVLETPVPLAPAGRPGASIVLYDGARLHAGQVTEREVARATAAQWLGNAVDEAGLDAEQPSAAAAEYLAWLWSRPAAAVGKKASRETLPRGVDAFRRLHETLGDSAFFLGLRRYIEQNRNATAAPGSLERAMTEAAGRRIDWTFDRALGPR